MRACSIIPGAPLWLAVALVLSTTAACDGGGEPVFRVGPRGSRAVESYDPVGDIWEKEVSAPEWLRGPECVAIGRVVYVTGGDRRGGRSFYAWDLAGGTWDSLPDLPVPRSNHACVAVGSDIYVLGGGLEISVDVFDTAARAWTSAEPLLRIHHSAEAAAWNGAVYVLGGQTSEVEALDPATGLWRFVAPMPRPLFSHAAVTDGGRIVVLGGSYIDPTGSWRFSDEVWSYDPAADAWSQETSLPFVAWSQDLEGALLGQEVVLHVDRKGVLVYDLVTGATRSASPPGAERERPGVASQGLRVYLIGG